MNKFEFTKEIITIEQAEDVLIEHGYELDGRRCRHSYDCCGNWYPSRIEFSITENGVVVGTQRWHQNI